MIRILSVCTALAAASLLAAPAADAAFLPKRIKVVEVIDGDDFYFSVPANGAASAGVTYRGKLMGVDAPDKQQCFTEKARQFLAELIEGKSVRVEYDSGDKFSDHGGFHIMYLYVDSSTGNELDVNTAMIKYGFARVSRLTSDYKKELRQLEGEARRLKYGGWAPKSKGGCIPD